MPPARSVTALSVVVVVVAAVVVVVVAAVWCDEEEKGLQQDNDIGDDECTVAADDVRSHDGAHSAPSQRAVGDATLPGTSLHGACLHALQVQLQPRVPHAALFAGEMMSQISEIKNIVLQINRCVQMTVTESEFSKRQSVN